MQRVDEEDLDSFFASNCFARYKSGKVLPKKVARDGAYL